MAKHQYVTNVLFDGDESEQDEYTSNGFRSRIPRPLPKITTSNGNETEQEHEVIKQKKQDIEKKTLESAMRSLKLLEETTTIGLETGKKLVEDGDKLNNANARLDEIDSHLKHSQKHINGIKSVFYGLKDYVSGKSRSPSPSRRHISPHKSPKKVKSKFYETIDHSLQGTTKLGDLESPCMSPQTLHVLSPKNHPSSQEVDDILHTHLDVMANKVEHLKVLGVEFGKEIDNQNELIDILHDKVEHANIKIDKQNKDMNKLL